MKAISDLACLDTSKAGEQGATLHVKHPVTGELMHVMVQDEPVPLTLTLLGSDSPTWKAKVFDTNRRRLREMQGARRQSAMSPERIDADALALLAEATVGWSGVVIDGKVVPCTPENAAMVYSRLPWLREQADEFANARENFTGESARN